MKEGTILSPRDDGSEGDSEEDNGLAEACLKMLMKLVQAVGESC